MQKKKLVAIAIVLVLLAAGTGAAVWMVISNSLDYEVTVEGLPITIEEATGPSGPLTRGTNHTYQITATVNAGSWACELRVNLTSPQIVDATYIDDFRVYVNDTMCYEIDWSPVSPNTFQALTTVGTLSEGEVVTLYWTLYMNFSMPIGAYSINVFLYGEEVV